MHEPVEDRRWDAANYNPARDWSQMIGQPPGVAALLVRMSHLRTAIREIDASCDPLLRSLEAMERGHVRLRTRIFLVICVRFLRAAMESLTAEHRAMRRDVRSRWQGLVTQEMPALGNEADHEPQ